MMKLLRPAAMVLTTGAVAACSPSGYHVMARSNCSQPVELRIQAMKKNDDSKVRTLDAPHIAPGSNLSVHTMAEHDEKVTLEARLVGEPASPAAVLPLFVGESRVLVGPNPDAATDAKQPKLRLRPDR